MKKWFRGSEVQRFVLLVCLMLTACSTAVQAAEVPQAVTPEPTQAEYRQPIITDGMRAVMDAATQPEAHECRANPIAIYWNSGARQYVITCKMSGTSDQYGLVYFNEDGGLRNTAVVPAYSYDEIARSLAWFGFGQ